MKRGAPGEITSAEHFNHLQISARIPIESVEKRRQVIACSDDLAQKFPYGPWPKLMQTPAAVFEPTPASWIESDHYVTRPKKG